MFRDIPFITAGTHVQTGSTAGSNYNATVESRVYDRGAFAQIYAGAVPYAVGVGFNSTEKRDITMKVKMQHGDAADGTGMADWEPHSEAKTWTYVHNVNSAANMYLETYNPVLDIRGTKRYVRAVATPSITSTKTSGDTGVLNLQVGLAFVEGDNAPPTQ